MIADNRMQGRGGCRGGGGGRGRKKNKSRKRDRRLGEIKYDENGKMIDDRNTEAGKLLGYKVRRGVGREGMAAR
jgi:hypothetical protein